MSVTKSGSGPEGCYNIVTEWQRKAGNNVAKRKMI